MSERGLILALQRLHDDPGFWERAVQDPQSTLGLYDLDEAERQTLFRAVQTRDAGAIRQMAAKVGIDWTADHIAGPGALPGDGYEGVRPQQVAGT
jgi:hypothetical protein